MSRKTGVPLDVLPKKGLTARQVERMERINDSDLPRVSTQPRSREESKDDRKLRKQAIKEERKVRNTSLDVFVEVKCGEHNFVYLKINIVEVHHVLR